MYPKTGWNIEQMANQKTKSPNLCNWDITNIGKVIHLLYGPIGNCIDLDFNAILTIEQEKSEHK